MIQFSKLFLARSQAPTRNLWATMGRFVGRSCVCLESCGLLVGCWMMFQNLYQKYREKREKTMCFFLKRGLGFCREFAEKLTDTSSLVVRFGG